MPGSEVPIALAYGAGLVAAVNPCGFAMLPAFLSYYLGANLSGRADRGGAAEGLFVGLVLAAGFMTVFGLAGILVSLGARVIVRIVPWIAVIMGAGLVGLGAWLLSGRHFGLALPGMRASEGSGYRSIFTFGIAYAIGSLSCTLPIFLLVVGGGLAAGSAAGTVGVFLAYGLGMSTLLMLLCLGTAGFREILVRRIRGLFPHLNRVSGALLVLGGGYIVYYWTSLLSGAAKSGPIRVMQEVQRRAQDFVLAVDERVWFVVGAALALVAVFLLWRRPGHVEAAQEETGESLEEAESRVG